MKRLALCSFVIGLSILDTSFPTISSSANAAPAPVFSPLIKDIRSQLPQGVGLRLPSFLPATNSKLYPLIDSRGNNFGVHIFNQPECTANVCYVGSFSVSRDSNQERIKFLSSESCLNAAKVTLKTGIQGIYSKNTCGGSGSGTQTVLWQQNGLYFGLALKLPNKGGTGSISYQEILDVASSMSSEPPIEYAQSNPSSQFSAQSKQKDTPPTRGECKTKDGWVRNCWQDVKWQQIPNSYSDFTGGYDYVGINTISRVGDAINFDFYSDGAYIRYAGNCRANVLAITKASDTLVAPDKYSPASNELRRRALSFACSRR